MDCGNSADEEEQPEAQNLESGNSDHGTDSHGK